MAANRSRVTNDEREAIIAAMRSGMGRNEIVRQFGRSRYTIAGIAKSIGHEFPRAKETAKAAEVKRRFNQAARLDLIDEGLAKAREMIQTIEKASDLKAWSISLGVLIDKARLEESDGGTNRGLIREFLNEQRPEVEPETTRDD